MNQSPLPLQPYQPRTWQRLFQRLGALRPCSWALSYLLPRLDRWMLRRSNGKCSLTTPLSGMPLITLTTTGARSGLPRQTSLIVIPITGGIVLIASDFGSPHHPDWYYNLIAHPRAQVSLDGQTAFFQARQARGEERQAYWRLAVSLYPVFEAYRRRAIGREIPVMVLQPVDCIRNTVY